MEFYEESVQAALEKCWQLVRDGQADLFRGQTRDRPTIVPSVFRTSGEGRIAALKELNDFIEWAQNVPQMGIYWGDEDSVTAIAQHYGIPTSFLDLTTNPEVAALFAKTSGDGQNSCKGVIYCFLEADLRSLRGLRITRINVNNLWRLEAQRGLFLQFIDESLTKTLRDRAICIYFPETRLSASERSRLYPVRKSALESVIDQWIYRRQIEGVAELFKQIEYKFFTHRETYPGAFRWRVVPLLEANWFERESAWVLPRVENVAISENPQVVRLPELDFTRPDAARRQLLETIEAPIRKYWTTGRLVSFVASLSDQKSHLSGSVSTIVNRCFDGLRVFPYEIEEMIASIALVATFVMARAEGIKGVDEWPKHFFGKLETVEVAPIGGHIEAGMVSMADLRNALSGEYLSRMTAYMRRKAEGDPGFPMMYIVDHWMLFSFNAFKKLFVEQFIPTAVDGYWKEDLSLYDGALGCMWGINFNPVLLAYVTPFSFRFHSPISGERDCSKIVYVLPDMTKEDLEEVFLSCLPSVMVGGEPFHVRFHEYSLDPRPIWEIDRVVEQSNWIVEVGGISVLEVAPSLTFETDDKIKQMFPTVGAFEIWMISKRLIQIAQGRTFQEIKPMFDEFYRDLRISNTNLDARARGTPDWPGGPIPK